jgi:hypothetical protein
MASNSTGGHLPRLETLEDFLAGKAVKFHSLRSVIRQLFPDSDQSARLALEKAYKLWYLHHDSSGQHGNSGLEPTELIGQLITSDWSGVDNRQLQQLQRRLKQEIDIRQALK